MVHPQEWPTTVKNNRPHLPPRRPIIEVVIQPPTTEAKVESDAPPAVITTQPAQPMPEHGDSIAVVMWEATVTGRRLIDEMVNLGSFYVAQEEKAEGHDFNEYEEKAEGHDFNEYVMPYGKLPLNALERYRLLDDVNKILLGCVNGWDLLRQQVTTEIVHDLKDEHRMVLKALADHHLEVDTPLESAVQRAQSSTSQDPSQGAWRPHQHWGT
ncbi:hypothetical protein DAPPUDRAFT_272933 [Daphnia pulex]|uniref:Uncharacterized protein n=1 Tax=Daphnia pulex TaxID=6669 RepID=E9I3A5_DAPPU|nr:hypothetical protein DAPPUDRAFT_272933 [Daphnia pulex]|eukprot:EFX61524.1 hypothetical protein DAPPUDRAFT_272933 [Daphnia pulex]